MVLEKLDNCVQKEATVWGNLYAFMLKSQTGALHFLMTVSYFLSTTCFAFFLVHSSCINKLNVLSVRGLQNRIGNPVHL